MKISNGKDKCLRCGKCCIVLNSVGRWVDCFYLTRDIKGFCTCRIYHKRFKKKGLKCHLRTDIPYNFPDCPYNKKGLNIHPAYKKDHG
jgi:hypothetical protein